MHPKGLRPALLALTLGLSTLALSGLAQPAHAGACSSYDADKAEYFSDRAGQRVLARLGPARDVITSVYSCSYNSYSKRFTVDVEISWSGAYNRNNKYWLTGQLQFDDNGDAADFRETGASQSWKDYRNASQILEAVVALGALSAQ